MKRNTNKKSFSGLWMLVGCVAVMLAAVALFANIESAGWGVLVLLLCPLMHIFMHRNMHHAGSHDRSNKPARQIEHNDKSKTNGSCH